MIAVPSLFKVVIACEIKKNLQKFCKNFAKILDVFLHVTTSETEIKKVSIVKKFHNSCKYFTCSHGLKSFSRVVKLLSG